ncbi:MarR family transcriptional regulator [Clostridium sp. HV4-5-A1G]|nr:MarR family transcriptional regulator [Clostridium sp. HV4-5-A1G]
MEKIRGDIMSDIEQLLFIFHELIENIQRMNQSEYDTWETDLKPAEIHLVDCIYKNAGSNLSAISDVFGITKGGVSKMLKRLQVKNTIVSFKKPGNNKELYFELTEKGKEIYKKHQEIHEKWKNRDSKILAKLNYKEIHQLLCSIQKLNQYVRDEIEEMRIE